MKTLIRITFAITLVVSITLSAAAQTIDTAILGSITDSSGAVVPGATVTVTGPQAPTATTTNGEGTYLVLSLIPGRYVVSVELSGFQKASRAVILEIGQKGRVDFALGVGGATETVAVQAAAQAISGTSSYARVMDNKEVKQRVDSVAEPIQRNYQTLIQQLRDKNAVGVVVAFNGRIVWADIFASTNLLEKYWPKLVRSYAAEAVVTRTKSGEVDLPRAQQFINQLDGRHETVDSEPGLYRHTEIAGDGFRAFELTSLLPKTGFDLHVAKMAE